MRSRARCPPCTLRSAVPMLAHPRPVRRDLPTHRAQRSAAAQRLDVAGRRKQPLVLVEVPTHELDGPVVVCVENGRAGVERLEPASGKGIAPEGLILAVRDVAEADLRPAGPAVARVHVGEERLVVDAVQDWTAGGREGREELGQLAGDHRARVGARKVRSEAHPHPRVERERFAVRRQPALDGDRVLRQEGKQVAGGLLGGEVARAAMTKLAWLELEHGHAGGAGESYRPVGRPRVNDENLVDTLAQQRGEQLGEVPHPVEDRDDRANGLAHPARRRSPYQRSRRPAPRALRITKMSARIDRRCMSSSRSMSSRSSQYVRRCAAASTAFVRAACSASSASSSATRARKRVSSSFVSAGTADTGSSLEDCCDILAAASTSRELGSSA